MADDRDEARKRAIAANAEAWRLIEQRARTAAEDAAMIDAAHESDRLWRSAGTGVNAQRGAWLIARAYVAAGIGEAARHFARETQALTERHADELKDFDLAFAEMIAGLAAAANADLAGARAHKAKAKAIADKIADPADKAEFFRQFEAAPWFGV